MVPLDGSWNAYLIRNAPSEYQESKYIALAMMSNLQIVILGVPILIVVSTNVTTNYFVRVGIIFLNDAGVLLFIFLPKLFAMHLAPKQIADGRTAATATSATATSAGGGTANMLQLYEEEIAELKAQLQKQAAVDEGAADTTTQAELEQAPLPPIRSRMEAPTSE